MIVTVSRLQEQTTVYWRCALSINNHFGMPSGTASCFSLRSLETWLWTSPVKGENSRHQWQEDSQQAALVGWDRPRAHRPIRLMNHHQDDSLVQQFPQILKESKRSKSFIVLFWPMLWELTVSDHFIQAAAFLLLLMALLWAEFKIVLFSETEVNNATISASEKFFFKYLFDNNCCFIGHF